MYQNLILFNLFQSKTILFLFYLNPTYHLARKRLEDALAIAKAAATLRAR